MSRWRAFLCWFHHLKHLIIIILTPMLILPIPLFFETNQAKAAFVVILMGVYWAFEVLPISITSLLPVIIFPFLNLMKSDQVCQQYLKDIVMLFIGGLMFAVGIERWNVHERIALFVLVKIGSNPKALLFGFMAVTSFLSMWISNTATTAMMVPIAHAVLESLKEGKGADEEAGEEGEDEDEDEEDEEERDIDEEMGNHVGEMGNHVGRRKEFDMKESSLGLGDIKEDQKYPDKVSLRQTPTTTRFRIQSDPLASSSASSRSGSRKGSVVPALGSFDSSLPIVTECFMNDKIEADDRATQPTPPPPTPAEKMTMLSICYAANIGGMATLTGTGPNTIFKGQLDTIYSKNTVSFANWFFFAFPVSFLCLVLAWIWLQLRWLGFRSLFCDWGESSTSSSSREDKRSAAIIRDKYDKLGPITYAEKSVLVMFTTMAMLWLFRSPGFIVGWGDLFGYEDKTITDATVAIVMSVMLFILPSENLFKVSFDASSLYPPTPYVPLLDWKTTLHNLPWGIVLLLGGGFALAEGCKTSCLSHWLGEQFKVFSAIPQMLFLFMLVLIGALTTEFTSNSSTATIFMPILISLADSLEMNPLKLTIPVILATSFAFMLPVATAPNAIVFSYGQLTIRDMMTTGIVMNVICIVIVVCGIGSWGNAIFNLEEVPNWTATNKTLESGNGCKI